MNTRQYAVHMDKVINDIEDSVLAFQKLQADICKLACSQMLRCVKKSLNLKIREILQRTSSVVGVGWVPLKVACSRSSLVGLRPCSNRPRLLTTCVEIGLLSTESEASEQWVWQTVRSPGMAWAFRTPEQRRLPFFSLSRLIQNFQSEWNDVILPLLSPTYLNETGLLIMLGLQNRWDT